jgi:hypothetical protein
MEKQSSGRLQILGTLVAAIFLAVPACEKRPQTTSATQQSQPSLEIRPDAPAKTGEPATVSRDSNSFASYIHFPKDATDDSAVQFYCDVSTEGAVDATYGLVGNDPAFKAAVQSALDWGRFKPASIDGKPVSVYLGGTVLFFHQNGQPVIVVSLATAERERVGQLANYIQPQLIGGLGDRLHRANSSLMWNRPWNGAAEVLFKVNGKGQPESNSVVSEIPKDSGLGDLLRNITQDAQWVPAYNDGKPTSGQINLVVNFGEY